MAIDLAHAGPHFSAITSAMIQWRASCRAGELAGHVLEQHPPTGQRIPRLGIFGHDLVWRRTRADCLRERRQRALRLGLSVPSTWHELRVHLKQEQAGDRHSWGIIDRRPAATNVPQGLDRTGLVESLANSSPG